MQTKVDYQKIALIQAEIRRRRAKIDPIFFAEYYLSHHLKSKTPDFHKEIYALLDEQRLAIAAPRGFAKSTIVQIIRGLQVLLTGKSEDILTISQSGSLASEWIRKIKIEMETNQRIQEDFGQLYKWGPEISRKWTEDHLTIDDETGRTINQVRAKGRGCQVRGFRPTRIFCDDLEDDELVRSSDQRQKLAHWFKGALMNTITLDQQVIIIGTLLHPLALLKEIIDTKEEFRDWKTRTFKALTDGKSIWEEKWPTEKLKRRKMEIGTYAFEAEFQNNPMASDSVLFRPDWIQTYEGIPGNIAFKVLIVDPAASEKESADETGMVVLGLTEDQEIYELDTLSGRWGIWDLIDNILAMYEKWEPDKIGIEKVAFQGVIKPILQREAGKRKIISLPVKQITVGTYSSKEKKEAKDKWTRAFKITHFFENKRVFLKSRKLIDQLMVFPTGDLDDLVDAMVYGLLMLKEFNSKTNIFKAKVPNQNKGAIYVQDPWAPPPYSWKPRVDWRVGV